MTVKNGNTVRRDWFFYEMYWLYQVVYNSSVKMYWLLNKSLVTPKKGLVLL